MKRVKGLKSLVQSAVEHGSRAVEKVQIEMAKTPFDLLEKVDPLKVPVAGVRMIYNTGVSTTHGMIRLVNKVVGETLDVVIDSVDQMEKSREAESAAAERPRETESAAAEKPRETESAAAEKPRETEGSSKPESAGNEPAPNDETARPAA